MHMKHEFLTDSEGTTRWVFEPTALCLFITGAILFAWGNVLIVLFGIAICHKWTCYMSLLGMTNVLLLPGLPIVGVLVFGFAVMRKKQCGQEVIEDAVV